MNEVVKLSDGGTGRAIVAQFQRHSGKLWLWSLTVIEEEVTPRGSYMMRKEYNVEHSKKFGYLFDHSGSGGGNVVSVDGLYYVSGDMAVRERPSSFSTRKMRRLNPTRRLQSMPRQFDVEPGQDILDWLERNGIQQDAVWCSVCRDNMPGESYNLCEHIWWCDKTAWYSTPSERCSCKDRDECYDGESGRAALSPSTEIQAGTK